MLKREDRGETIIMNDRSSTSDNLSVLLVILVLVLPFALSIRIDSNGITWLIFGVTWLAQYSNYTGSFIRIVGYQEILFTVSVSLLRIVFAFSVIVSIRRGMEWSRFQKIAILGQISIILMLVLSLVNSVILPHNDTFILPLPFFLLLGIWVVKRKGAELVETPWE